MATPNNSRIDWHETTCAHETFQIGCEFCGTKLEAKIKADYEKMMIQWNKLPIEQQKRIMAEMEANALDYNEMMGGAPNKWITDWRNPYFAAETLMAFIADLQNKGLEPSTINFAKTETEENGEMWRVTVTW